jgi:hypothetical protein
MRYSACRFISPLGHKEISLVDTQSESKLHGQLIALAKNYSAYDVNGTAGDKFMGRICEQ